MKKFISIFSLLVLLNVSYLKAQKKSSTSKSHTDTTIICTVCDGEGSTPCNDCFSGITVCKACKGSGSFKCTSCNGRGVYSNGFTCGGCRGGGIVLCNGCTGKGEVSCSKCRGSKIIDCRYCYGKGLKVVKKKSIN